MPEKDGSPGPLTPCIRYLQILKLVDVISACFFFFFLIIFFLVVQHAFSFGKTVRVSAISSSYRLTWNIPLHELPPLSVCGVAQWCKYLVISATSLSPSCIQLVTRSCCAHFRNVSEIHLCFHFLNSFPHLIFFSFFSRPSK